MNMCLLKDGLFLEHLDRVRRKLQITAQTTRKSSGMLHSIGYHNWGFVLTLRAALSLDCAWNSRFDRRFVLSYRGRDRKRSYGYRGRCV